MEQIREYIDEQLKGVCVHCGNSIFEGNFREQPISISDHVPSKCLLQEPYPENLPVTNIC